MEVHLTPTRLTIVAFGLAFKFARIRLLKVVVDYFSIRSKSSWREQWREYRRLSGFNAKEDGVRYFVTYGIISNRNERAFWKEHKDPFCAKTYRSLFFGFLNIQEAPGDSIHWGEEEFWTIMKKTKRYAGEDKRRFSNPDNFRVVNEKLVITNYGHPDTQKVILRSGKKMQNLFSNLLS